MFFVDLICFSAGFMIAIWMFGWLAEIIRRF